MRNYDILVDTTADLTNDTLLEHNIKLIKAHFKDEKGNDQVSFSDWVDNKVYDSSATFYKLLKGNVTTFSTAPNSIPEIVDAMTESVSKGKDLLVICISSTMSGTYNFYNTAKAQVLEKYPDSNILVYDTLRYGSSCGLMAINASIKRSEGKTLTEVYDYLETNKKRFHQMGWLDDLSFVAKKGRITHAKAFFGTLIGIKPLGECNQNGLTTVLGKAKGEKPAFEAMIEYIKQVGEDLENQVVLISHSNRKAQALKYKELIENNFHPKKIYFNELGPSCAINVGPGLVGAYFMGKELSEDCENEIKIMEKILTK